MLDYISIFRELNQKKIKYIVVGGVAVNFYGIPRMTYDIDLLLDLEDKNLKKFLELLKGWNFKPKISIDIMDFTKKRKREFWIR
jgi:molybdenum cofactor biosynthesis enzyme MoaA